MSSLTLQAHWVLPVDQRPFEGGVVSIRDGQIVSVGPRAAHFGAFGRGPVHDLGDVVLLPGLVNAHTHLEFSQLKQPLGRPGMPLPKWIRLAIGDRKRARRDPAQAIRAGLEESIQLGTTTVGEITTSPVALYEQHGGTPALALFDEVIGFSAARVDSVLAVVAARWSISQGKLSPACHLGLSPHAPYTVHPRLLAGLIDLAIEHRLPVAMHLAESAEEMQLLARGDGPFQQLLEERSMWDDAAIPSGTCALDYLKHLARAPRCLVVHGNYLQTRDFEFLAQQEGRMTVVYCPRTHAYFGHRPYPLAEMLTAGVPVALGTDSRASSPDLSMLAEMRAVAHKHPKIAAEKIVRLGTTAGARALGWEKCIGSITAGKWADLTAIPCPRGCRDPYALVVGSEAVPIATWLRGELACNRKAGIHTL